jgi:indolepyruvate ferredoxin oxidoreductase, alpha subunit
MKMKTSNKSIEAIVCGLIDGGCVYTTNFAGFNSHKIFEGLGGGQMSVNERVAYEMAYGASIAGKRSVVSFKGVGMNVAADSFLHSVLNGINAGLVVVLTDDIEAVSSPESQDSRPYRDIFGGLWLEPSSLQEAYDFGYDAFDLSERFDMPVVIRLTNQFFVLNGNYVTKKANNKIIQLEKKRKKYISYWKIREEVLKNKLNMVDEYVNNLYRNNNIFSKTKGIIVVGNGECELQMYNQKDYDFLRLSVYPLPKSVIEKFSEGKTEITVIEQGRDYAYRQIGQLINPSCKLKSITADRPDKSESWIVWDNLEKLFCALADIKPSFVVGDEGTFTDESTHTIQMCLAMGSSIGITAGLVENGIKYPLCVIGDTSLTFAGLQTLMEVRERGLKFGIVVIDNGGAKSTGGQKRMGDIYDVGNIPKVVVDYEKKTKRELFDILYEMKTKGELAILFVKTK